MAFSNNIKMEMAHRIKVVGELSWLQDTYSSVKF